MLELTLLGTIVGVLSGFFGIGGGTIVMPMLLALGYDTKVAIGIAVTQMVFSSVYGSYLNNKKGTLDVAMVSIIGLGGFIGASFSGFITASFSNRVLEFLFLGFALFALLRLFFKTHEYHKEKTIPTIWLFLIGAVIGTLSMTIGVGGSIVLVPTLVGFFHVPLKKAISAGLFFVVFSSLSGFISHALEGHIDYESGIIIGVASLLGVYIGIHFKERVTTELQKKMLVILYLIIVLYFIQRVFF